MASTAREYMEPYEQAVIIYEDLSKKVKANSLSDGDYLPYFPMYNKAFDTTAIVNICKDLLSTRNLGCELENIDTAFRFKINGAPSTPLVCDYQRQILSYKDITNLYYECVKIFTNKLVPPKAGDYFGFQQRYAYGFTDLSTECNDIIVQISTTYLNGLVCNDSGSGYYVVG